MILLELDRYKLLMKHVKEHALALNHHEREQAIENLGKRPLQLHDIVQTNFPITQCWEYRSEGFVLCFNNSFFYTIQLYESVFKENPEAFQNGDAIDIIKALYAKSNYWSSVEDYQEYLQIESCCYVVLFSGDSFGEILRIDLFRKLDLDAKSDRIEFTGGLFHCLKHFSMNGINLCNGSDLNETFDVMHIVYIIGRCFYSAIHSKSEEGILSIDDSHFYKADFYYEICSSVYFIKSIRIAEPEKERKKHNL
jgi:hypothetical protein